MQGNENWMRAREAMLASDLLPGLDGRYPICTPGASDTARFDEVLELLHLGGYPIHHAMLMMIPEAWENHATMPQEQRDFYRFHASMMEPWDGPASVAFTDGEVIGAVLDRNGLRPSRYWVTDDDLVVMASEVGVIDIEPSKVVAKGRLQPGKMFLIDTREGRDRQRRRDQVDRSPRSTRTASGWKREWSTCATCPTASTSCSATTACCAASRCSATPTRS